MYRRCPAFGFQGRRNLTDYIDKSIIQKEATMVLPVPGRAMVKREEKKSPWASLGAVIALTVYLIKVPDHIK